MLSTPTDEQVLQALRVIRAWWFGGASASRVYTQYDLPPGAKSAGAYKTRHRALRRAGVPGARVLGKILECTAAAWNSDLTRARLKIVPAAPVDELDQQLGIRTRRASP